MVRKTMGMVLLWCACRVAAGAQGTVAEPTLRTDEVHLSAERTATTPTLAESLLTLLPVSASVVTAQDIALTNARATTDILGMLPGVFIRRTGAFGRTDPYIRGIGDNGRQIGVFINGRPDKMAYFGCSVTHTLPLNNVERIELIRGPESVLYGSEAFGGAVNIITRRAHQPIEGMLTASAGSFNTITYRLQHGARVSDADYFISINRDTSDGHTANAAYNATDFSASGAYRLPGGGEVVLDGKFFDGVKNEPYPSPAGTWNDYARGSFEITGARPVGPADLSLKAYRTFGEHRFSDGFHSRDYTDGVMAHARVGLFGGNTLLAGVDTRFQNADILAGPMPARMLGRFAKSEFGVFVHDEHTLWNRLTFTGGVRWNSDEYAGSVLTPKAGVVFNTLRGTVLRVLYSEGFRAPQLNDMYQFAGNPDLRPERIANTEGGVRQSIGDAVFIDVAVYHMEGWDLIRPAAGRKQNIGRFQFNGVETMLSVRIAEGLSAQANYTWFDPGVYTMGQALDKAGASLAWRRNRVSAMVSGQYVGRYYAADNAAQRIDDYVVVDAKVDVRVLEFLSVFAAIDNATDTSYTIYNSGLYSGLYQMPGRSVTAGMTVRFN